MSALRVVHTLRAEDLTVVHGYLNGHAYWSRGIPLETLRNGIANSLCFVGLQGDALVAFARVISDYATFANLVDVFVLPEYRGQGLARQLLESVLAHPQLQGLRRFTLATADAHGLYSKFGFTPLARPETFMERYTAGIYARAP
jgi:GNAT superfamily N-acetyltransferase